MCLAYGASSAVVSSRAGEPRRRQRGRQHALDERACGLLAFDAENCHLQSARPRASEEWRYQQLRVIRRDAPRFSHARRSDSLCRRRGHTATREPLDGRPRRRGDLAAREDGKRGQNTGCTLIAVSLDLAHESARHLGRHPGQFKGDQQRGRKLLQLGRIGGEQASSEDRAERGNELVFKDGLLGVGQSIGHVEKRYAVGRRNLLRPDQSEISTAGRYDLCRSGSESHGRDNSHRSHRPSGIHPAPESGRTALARRSARAGEGALRRHQPATLSAQAGCWDWSRDWTGPSLRRITPGASSLVSASRRTGAPACTKRVTRTAALVRGQAGLALLRRRARVEALWRRARPGETLEPYVGQWVATKGPEVLVGASDPRAVVGWLAEHGQQADSMFRVPQDQFEASGVAPS